MPWYRFEMRHGPGHQGTDVVFRYYGETLTTEGRKDQWHELADARSHGEQARGELTPVDGLPAEVIAAQRKKYEQQIVSAQAMLRVLDATAVVGDVPKRGWESYDP